ncbi:MAG: hypothetical protein JNK15_15385 [Planctomycetes bacterium]|nr:hypothetical protein [Planctomycetota bacterium]
MDEPSPTIDPASTRLGQLQRGRGAGHAMARHGGTAAHDDILHCLLVDPRVDRQTEQRARYLGELIVAVDLPLEPLLRSLGSATEAGLGHDALAAAWALGHAPTRALLGDPATPEAVVAGIVACLHGERWARLVEMPAHARALWLQLELPDADSTASQRRVAAPTALAALSVHAVLELARGPESVRRDRLLGELCARGDAATRAHLAAVVADDLVLGRVRLAARALGLLGDERLLPLAEDLFGRPDVFEDPTRRLPADLRMRRACLADYTRHLPAAIALPLARAWHGRGDYFTTVAGTLFELHATAADRARLEAFVAANAPQGGITILDELDALARLGDPASVPLLCDVAATATYSLARARAITALTRMAHAPAAQQVLREALWDCEDEASATACAFVIGPDAAAADRIRALAASPLVDDELAGRAQRSAATRA